VPIHEYFEVIAQAFAKLRDALNIMSPIRMPGLYLHRAIASVGAHD
jgi:hypothetical protein